QPARPAGRGQQPQPSAVERVARDAGLPVRTPARVRDAETIADFAALDLDLAVVAAYGLILPQALLDAPRRGCINLPASLLPPWRAPCAPSHRAPAPTPSTPASASRSWPPRSSPAAARPAPCSTAACWSPVATVHCASAAYSAPAARRSTPKHFFAASRCRPA